jgi:hypothetical protein
VSVDLEVCLDTRTLDLIKPWFDVAKERLQALKDARLLLRPFSASHLLRRAIGRNIVARECVTDVCWFADADYVCGPGCLESIVAQVHRNDTLRFPAVVLEHVDHETGDKMIEDNKNELLPEINPALFKPRRRKYAIGGLQIVGGNTTRELGYLPGTKWCQPVDESRGWRQTGEDMAYRRVFDATGGSKPIDVKNLYWLRHSVKGADLDGQGEYVGKGAW